MPMQVPIPVPDLGVASATLSVWYAKPGDHVHEGDRIIELLTECATFDVPAPASGKLVKQSILQDQNVLAGDILGIIRAED